MCLVEDPAQIVLHQKRQGKPRQGQHSTGLSSVEHVNDVDAKVALQPLNVQVGAMEDFDDIGIGEEQIEFVNVIAQRERVDDVVLGARRQLDQTRDAEISPVRVMLESGDGKNSKNKKLFKETHTERSVVVPNLHIDCEFFR